MNQPDSCMITVALTGVVTRKEQNPNPPCSPAEIASSAIESWQAGASIAHIHVRNPDSSAAHDLRLYREIIERLRAETDLLLNLTTSYFPGMSEA